MPNWVKNKIRISGNKERIAELIKRADSDVSVFDFNAFVPTPSNVYQGNLGPKEEAMYPGDLNWYDWNCNHWGTKWNACDPIEIHHHDNIALIEFETAWDAPIPVYEAMAEQYPDLDIHVKYADEDYGNNAGIWHNGDIQFINDEEFSCDVWGTDFGQYLQDRIEYEEYLKNYKAR